jgi:transposase-like protein
MWEILMLGLSTRKYAEVLPKMAETVGVSKSEVSRQFVESSAEVLKQLMERRLEEWDILIVYLDGIVFGDYHAIAAIGVDTEGSKHILGLREGASENKVVAKALLEDLVERGLNPERRRLFVIDGSKALRRAIDAVFGSDNLVQRCRKHKERNVLGYLPEELKDQVQSTLRSAWQLSPQKGKARLEKLAKWFEDEYPSAAESVREGLEEMFTISELGLPASLTRCLGSTNIIESCFSGTRGRTRRVSNWQDGSMVLRWAASALLATEKNFPTHPRLRGAAHLRSQALGPRPEQRDCSREEAQLELSCWSRHPPSTGSGAPPIEKPIVRDDRRDVESLQPVEWNGPNARDGERKGRARGRGQVLPDRHPHRGDSPSVAPDKGQEPTELSAEVSASADPVQTPSTCARVARLDRFLPVCFAENLDEIPLRRKGSFAPSANHSLRHHRLGYDFGRLRSSRATRLIQPQISRSIPTMISPLRYTSTALLHRGSAAESVRMRTTRYSPSVAGRGMRVAMARPGPPSEARSLVRLSNANH